MTYRLMSDGVFLEQTVWSKLGPNRRPHKSGWEIAKVTPEIKANPDLLLTHGFQKNE